MFISFLFDSVGNALTQDFERMNRQLTDAAALASHLVLPGGMFAFLAAHRAEVFPDAAPWTATAAQPAHA